MEEHSKKVMMPPTGVEAVMMAKKGKTRDGDELFEFCEVCNLNHDQGRRHKYFPTHARAISDVLSRFHKKLTDIRFFVRNPMLLRPEDAVLSRIWCIFCALDVREIGSFFICGNAISHLASKEHLKNLKSFLCKHGGGIDRVDSFRVFEADLLKWEKGCENLKIAASTSREGFIGPALETSKELRTTGYVNPMVMFVQLLPMVHVSLHQCPYLEMWGCIPRVARRM